MLIFLSCQVFTEEETRFYIAELVLSIESIHQYGYIHRFDSFLITKFMHVFLTQSHIVTLSPITSFSTRMVTSSSPISVCAPAFALPTTACQPCALVSSAESKAVALGKSPLPI